MGPDARNSSADLSLTITVIRQVMLGVLLLGLTGLLAELLLTGHYDGATQQIPLVVLGAGLATILLDLVSPQPWTNIAIRVTMGLCVAVGLLGMFFHFQGSREFQREMDPALAGVDLVWHVLRAKSPPTLAPGSMVQLGILGLGYAYVRRRRVT